MALWASIEDPSANLSATCRSFFEVFSPSSATIDVDMVNYSPYAVMRRERLQNYWSVFDGITRMVSVYTKDTEDGEEAKCDMRSVRALPRYPPSYCTRLAEFDNAILGFVTNHLVKLGYYMTNFPPPFITADVVFVPAPENTRGRELLTVCISDDSIGLIRPTDSWCFSHPLLQESQIIIKKGVVRRIGAGTVFVFVKVKDIEEARPTEEIMSYSGEKFKLDGKFAQKIQTLYGTIPRELLSMTKVFRYQEASVGSIPLPFEDYVEEMTRGSIRILVNHVILGVFSGVLQPKHIEKLCAVLGSFINLLSEAGVGFIDIARQLGFTQI